MMKSYQCPACSGAIKYDPVSGMDHCEACGNYYYIGRQGVDFNCPNCGADLRFDSESGNLNCRHCGAKFDILEAEDESVIPDPEYIIPFSVSEEEIKKRFLDELVQQDYVPVDVFQKIGFHFTRGTYLPYYRIKFSYRVDYSASIGYERTEKYTDYETVYENGRSYEKPVTKERTVIDWRPHSGTLSGSHVIWVSGLADGQTNPAYSLEAYEGGAVRRGYEEIAQGTSVAAKVFDERYLAGFRSVPFTKDADTAWEDGSSRRRLLVDRDVENTLSGIGDRYKDSYWSGQFYSDDSSSFFFPVWTVSYTYNGNNHTFIANGSDASLNYSSPPQDTSSRKTAKNLYIPFISWIILAVVFFIVLIASAGNRNEHVLLSAIPIVLCVGVITWIIGFFGKRKYLSNQRAERAIGKELALKNPDTFFKRPPA